MSLTRRSAIFAAGALLATRGAAGAQRAPALPVLHVGGSADMDAAPIIYGLNAGVFRRYGLDVVFQKAASGSANRPRPARPNRPHRCGARPRVRRSSAPRCGRGR